MVIDHLDRSHPKWTDSLERTGILVPFMESHNSTRPLYHLQFDSLLARTVLVTPSVRVALWFPITLVLLIDFFIRFWAYPHPAIFAVVLYFALLFSGMRLGRALRDHLDQWDWGSWNFPPYDWEHGLG